MNQWDKAAEVFDKIVGQGNDPPRLFLYQPALEKLLGDLQDKVILDAGCGNGYFEKNSGNLAREIIAIDYSKKLIEIAKSRVCGGNVSFKMADLEKPLDFEKEYFDLIISNMVLHFLKDIQTCAGEFYRVLKSGGKLVFSVPHPDYYSAKHDGKKVEAEIKVKEMALKGTSLLAYFYRPLDYYEDCFEKAGFKLAKVLEPPISEELVEVYPHFAKFVGIPRAAFFSFSKP